MSNNFKISVILIFFVTCIIHGLWIQSKLLYLDAMFKAHRNIDDNQYRLLMLENSSNRFRIKELEKACNINPPQ